MNDLFKNHSSIVWPAKNRNDTIVLTCDTALQTIVDFEWTDNHFHWNPEDYSGINNLVVPLDSIWKPDVYLGQSRKKGNNGVADSHPLVTSGGVVYWNTPANLHTHCRIDASYFPFDEQRCLLQFSSWSYNDDALHVEVKNPYGDISKYQDNGIWELLAVLQNASVTYYNCCPTPYSTFTITIILRRRPLFYISNLLIPCLLIVATTLCSFLLAVDSGEKTSLVVTNLLSLIVFMNHLSNAVPSTADGIPLMVKYIAVTIAIVSISMVVTIWVLRIHYQPSLVTPAPGWLKRLTFTYMAKLLLVWAPHYKEVPAADVARGVPIVLLPSYSQQGESSSPGSRVEDAVAVVSQRLKCLTSRCKRKDAAKEILSEWKHVARIIDRMLFLLFLVVTIAMTSPILLQSKPLSTAKQIAMWQGTRQ
ncbi:neuronal acetylcholine receptor subunit alpha-10-like [Acanthaster planci]|uniref:Neuronal acetylcholine receptor subunit alpha-10-like n=1 Tax=Acanthaster planci TaxID=133434 RepID=A0A8B7YT46_ACAPL|nr:neuronal acetylcholine receptor subunit alpha-10-like [Acanthaster planci]